MDEDKRDTAANRIAKTNIIPGMLLSLLKTVPQSMGQILLVGILQHQQQLRLLVEMVFPSATPTRYQGVPMHYSVYFGMAYVAILSICATVANLPITAAILSKFKDLYHPRYNDHIQ